MPSLPKALTKLKAKPPLQSNLIKILQTFFLLLVVTTTTGSHKPYNNANYEQSPPKCGLSKSIKPPNKNFKIINIIKAGKTILKNPFIKSNIAKNSISSKNILFPPIINKF